MPCTKLRDRQVERQRRDDKPKRMFVWFIVLFMCLVVCLFMQKCAATGVLALF